MGQSDVGEMRVAIVTLLFAGSALAAPQLEGIKNFFSSLGSGDESYDDDSDIEKVPHTTLKKFDGYEMRQYPSVKWACTELTYEREEDLSEAEVDDVEEGEAAATLKALREWQSKKRNRITKEMCFYIEKKHQANPPTPVDSDVKIETNKEFTVYVHTFGGYAMKDAVNIREARKFAKVLDKAGEEVDKSFFYTAGYDSPMKFWNRRNEIMYLVPGGR